MSRSKRLCKADDTHVAPITKSQCAFQVSFATLLKYSTHETMLGLSFLRLGLAAPSACLISTSTSFVDGRPPQTSSVYCHPCRAGDLPWVLRRPGPSDARPVWHRCGAVMGLP